MDKKLKYLYYYSVGGFINTSDIHNISLSIVSKNILNLDTEVYFSISFNMGSILLNKKFYMKDLPYLKDYYNKLNNYDYNHIKLNTTISDDLPIAHLEYCFYDNEEQHIEDFDDEELMKLLDKLIDELLKDKIIQNIIKTIIITDNHYDYPMAKGYINKK